jgi:hypothetical protein
MAPEGSPLGRVILEKRQDPSVVTTLQTPFGPDNSIPLNDRGASYVKAVPLYGSSCTAAASQHCCQVILGSSIRASIDAVRIAIAFFVKASWVPQAKLVANSGGEVGIGNPFVLLVIRGRIWSNLLVVQSTSFPFVDRNTSNVRHRRPKWSTIATYQVVLAPFSPCFSRVAPKIVPVLELS